MSDKVGVVDENAMADGRAVEVDAPAAMSGGAIGEDEASQCGSWDDGPLTAEELATLEAVQQLAQSPPEHEDRAPTTVAPVQARSVLAPVAARGNAKNDNPIER